MTNYNNIDDVLDDYPVNPDKFLQVAGSFANEVLSAVTDPDSAEEGAQIIQGLNEGLVVVDDLADLLPPGAEEKLNPIRVLVTTFNAAQAHGPVTPRQILELTLAIAMHLNEQDQ